MNLRNISLLAVVVIMGACQKAPIIVSGCPHVKTWTKEQQQQMLKEEKTLPDNAILTSAMIDYARMRNEARACQ